jgi:hypothetical protein
MMADSRFYGYREKLLRFLDDCGHAKAAKAPAA